MSEITATLSKIKESFKTWHNNYYDELHTRTTNEINRRINAIEAANQTSVSSLTSQILSIGQILSRSIDNNTTDINNLSDIANALANKTNHWETGNLQALDALTQQLKDTTDFIENDYASKGYVTSLVSASGMKTMTIPSGANLNNNNYRNLGFFKCISTADSNTIQNIPTAVKGNVFNLVVINADENQKHVKQIILMINSSNVSNRIFTRNCLNGNWTSWQELYGTHNAVELPMEVTFEDSNNTTQTYKLLRVIE